MRGTSVGPHTTVKWIKQEHDKIIGHEIWLVGKTHAKYKNDTWRK